MSRTISSKKHSDKMTRLSRRRFLSQIGAVAGATAVMGCGSSGNPTGSAGAAPTSPATPSTPVTPTTPTAPPSTPVPPPSSGAMQFFISAPSSGTKPFAIGFVFRRGDIAAGQFPVASLSSSQVTVLTRWPDGSAKWAVIAGRAPLTANTVATVTLSASASAPTGTALTLSQLAQTGISATVNAGAFGSANWSGADWNSPFRNWVSGPEMSSWLYRKPVGTDAHLVAWLEVRLFADGNVDVLPWVENGYLHIAGPTNKNAVYSFTLGGTQRFSGVLDLPNRCRTPLLSGSALSHWLGADPNINVRHDTDYLQATELVPSYYAQTPADSPSVISLPGAFTPLQQGSLPPLMGESGYHGSIGLLPEWDVLYLTCQDSSAPWSSLQRNAYSSGRYGIHFRDETTNEPLRFSDHPTLVMGDGNAVVGIGSSSTNLYTAPGTGIPSGSTGTSPSLYRSSHQPAMGYLAALVTGRAYHSQTVQFQATANYLKNGDQQRRGSEGVFQSNAGANTTRGAAWAWRTLAQAAAVTPDSDSLQGEFLASMTANVDYYHTRYVAQATNTQGWVAPYEDYDPGGAFFGAAWQQDFFTASVGMSRAMGLALGAATEAKLASFFNWKAISVIGRFGGTGGSEYLYRDAAVYTIAIAPTNTPDYASGTGPWYSNWGEVYSATHLTSPGPRTDGDLRGGNFPEPTSYWGNLQPALAYAVRFGVAGASVAYARMTSATNWNLFEARFDQEPVWGVRPAVAQ